MSSESHCLHPLLPTQRNKKLLIVSGNAATTTSFLKFNLLYSRTVSWIGVYFLTFSVVIFVLYCFMHFILHFIKWLYLLTVIVYCLHIVKCVRLTCINACTKQLWYVTYLLTYSQDRPRICSRGNQIRALETTYFTPKILRRLVHSRLR